MTQEAPEPETRHFMAYGFGLWMFRLVVIGVPIGMVLLIGYMLTRTQDRAEACEIAGGVVVLDRNRQPICIRKDAVLPPSAPKP
jgi:hypothetical protein